MENKLRFRDSCGVAITNVKNFDPESNMAPFRYVSPDYATHATLAYIRKDPRRLYLYNEHEELIATGRICGFKVSREEGENEAVKIALEFIPEDLPAIEYPYSEESSVVYL